MSSHGDNASLSKSEKEDGAFTSDKEKALVRTPSEDGGDAAGNVGLHEFALAKRAGLRVTREESRR